MHPLSEAEVLKKIITYFEGKGFRVAYQTAERNHQGGVDAFLVSNSQLQRFVFIEAKGSYEEDSRRSSEFNNVLGAILKRMKIVDRYESNENNQGFIQEGDRDLIENRAKMENSIYVLALTDQMENRVKQFIDPQLAKNLNLEVYIVEAEQIKKIR